MIHQLDNNDNNNLDDNNNNDHSDNINLGEQGVISFSVSVEIVSPI